MIIEIFADCYNCGKRISTADQLYKNDKGPCHYECGLIDTGSNPTEISSREAIDLGLTTIVDSTPKKTSK